MGETDVRVIERTDPCLHMPMIEMMDGAWREVYEAVAGFLEPMVQTGTIDFLERLRVLVRLRDGRIVDFAFGIGRLDAIEHEGE